MNLHEQFGYLCAIVATQTNNYEVSSLPPQWSMEEWFAFVNLADRNEVLPFLFSRIRDYHWEKTIPPAVYDKLRKSYLSNAARNTILLHEASTLISAFQVQKIDVVGLKGIYLVENAYSDIALRRIDDVDFLVPPNKIKDAIRILEGLGYTQSTYFNPQDSNMEIKHVPPMFKPHYQAVELHWTILEDVWPFSIDLDGLWERAIPCGIGSGRALALSTEDLLLHLCLHFTYQHRLKAGLRYLVDIQEVLASTGGQIDWYVLCERAKSWGLEKILRLTFALLKDFLGIEIPLTAHNYLHLADMDQDILAAAKLQIITSKTTFDLTPDLASFSSAGIGGRFRIAMRRIFLPRNLLARLYNISPNSPRVLLYYPVRFLYLVRRYTKNILRIISNDQIALQEVTREKENQKIHDWLQS